jgi:hypothetical protein
VKPLDRLFLQVFLLILLALFYEWFLEHTQRFFKIISLKQTVLKKNYSATNNILSTFDIFVCIQKTLALEFLPLKNTNLR